ASRPAAGARSWRAPFEAPEAAVVVVGVEELHRRVAAGDDAARAAVARAGRVDRVLAVVAARALGQQPLAVLEHATVLAVRVGTAGADQRQRLACFRRQPGGGRSEEHTSELQSRE